MNRVMRFTKIWLPVILGLGCILLCLVIWFGYIALADDEYVTLTDTEVALDANALPENPTEDDWYALAVQVLEAQGWNVSPNLTWLFTVGLSCAPNPTLNRLVMTFADFYMEGLVPSVKHAELEFDRAAGIVKVHISYSPMHWRHSTLDLSKTIVDFYQAIAIADAYGGQEFRESVNNACDMKVALTSRNVWSVVYRENGQRWENWEIRVDAITGEASRRNLP